MADITLGQDGAASIKLIEIETIVSVIDDQSEHEIMLHIDSPGSPVDGVENLANKISAPDQYIGG